MNKLGFWKRLFEEKKPIIGLSPMDGVTDAPFRFMVAKYGKPDIIFTEFVSVDALHYAIGERRKKLLKTLIRTGGVEVAQVFGHTPEFFVEAAELIEKLGFDGIDINMGCPAHKVEEHGSGAGLIRTPKIAQEIIRVTKAATKLPVSVKTRIGINSDVAEEWMSTLMEVKPACISLHGRTLRQLYRGRADWDAIARAAVVVHKAGGHILGNGDVKSVQQAAYSVQQYGVDGVLIGRAAEGNPWVFNESQSSDHSSKITQGSELWKRRQIEWMVEHARKFEEIFGEGNFMPMRKHLAWYCHGFEGAVELRMRLMQTNNASEVKRVIKDVV